MKAVKSGCEESIPATMLAEAAQAFLGHAKACGRAPDSIRCYRLATTSFASYAEANGVEAMCEVTPELVEAYRQELARTHSAQTVYTEIGVLKSLFKWAHEHHRIQINPIYYYRQPYVRSKRPEARIEQVNRILESCDPSAYGVVATLAFTGIRESELWALKCSDVNLDEGWLSVQPDPSVVKNCGVSRAVPIHPRLLSILRRPKYRGPKWFFSFEPGRRLDRAESQWKSRDLHRLFASACARADAEGFAVHGMRRFFEVFCLNNLIAERVVWHWLGRANYAVAARQDGVPKDRSKTLMNSVPFGVENDVVDPTSADCEVKHELTREAEDEG